ncbi:MAG: GntR family transcriptional regulator [Chloroflexi bacterium]|nr:GntR family transcriptional regulator [Chloroflexota bacterium]
MAEQLQEPKEVMVEEKQAKPLYQVVAAAILKQINEGQLRANDRLPSEHELCQIYSVGRNTVRRALSELARDGVLESIPGVGTFVSGERFDKTAQYLYGFTHEMRLHGKQVSSRVIEAKLISADPFLARRLQIQLGAEVVFLYRVRMMDGEPTAIERSYLPHDLCPGILQYDFSTASLYEVLTRKYNKSPNHAEQVIEAGLATAEVARLLELDQPAVVLVFHRETRLASGQVIEYVDSELRGDRFRFYADLRLQARPDAFAFRRLPLPIETEARA